MRFVAGGRREFLWIESSDLGGVGFGPAGSGSFMNGDREFGMRFAIGGKEAAGISESGLAVAVRIDSGSNLAILDGQIAGAPDRAGSIFGGGGDGLFDEAVHAALALLSAQGQEARGLRLAWPEGERRLATLALNVR